MGLITRRTFGAALGGVVAWPIGGRAQQPERVRLVGMLIAAADNDPQYQSRVAAFRETLAKLGWVEGRNLRTDLRYGTGDTQRMRDGAAALVELAPEVILVSSTPAAKAVRQLSETVPIVFTTITDPVATGLVGNLARPEFNATGFPLFEPSIAGKWLELLKEIAPHVRRMAQLSDPAIATEPYFTAVEAAARALAVQVLRVEVRNMSTSCVASMASQRNRMADYCSRRITRPARIEKRLSGWQCSTAFLRSFGRVTLRKTVD
jgi:putative ABC transport system substrate-binding protein